MIILQKKHKSSDNSLTANHDIKESFDPSHVDSEVVEGDPIVEPTTPKLTAILQSPLCSYLTPLPTCCAKYRNTINEYLNLNLNG